MTGLPETPSDDPYEQYWWYEKVYLPALKKAFDGDYYDLAVLCGDTRLLNREQELDEKDGDRNQ